MSEDSAPKADVERLDKILEQLGEHYDTVQIFCSRCDGLNEGATIIHQKGTGNFYARVGQVKEWLIRQDEIVRIETRKEFNE